MMMNGEQKEQTIPITLAVDKSQLDEALEDIRGQVTDIDEWIASLRDDMAKLKAETEGIQLEPSMRLHIPMKALRSREVRLRLNRLTAALAELENQEQ